MAIQPARPMTNGKGSPRLHARTQAAHTEMQNRWNATFSRCQKHPRYKAVQKPREDCARCWAIYFWRHQRVKGNQI